MESKLFNDEEYIVKPKYTRPNSLNEEEKDLLLENLAKECIAKHFIIATAFEDVVSDLESVYPFNYNGFDIAVIFDSSNVDYSIDSEFVSWCEDLERSYDLALQEKVKKYIIDNDILPKFNSYSDSVENNLPILKFKKLNSKIEDVFYITVIKKDIGIYLISNDINKNGGAYVNFEDLENEKIYQQIN